MHEKEYLLFINDYCPPCKVVKQFLGGNDRYFKVKQIDTHTDEGLQLARDYSVSATPTLLVKVGDVIPTKFNGDARQIIDFLKEALHEEDNHVFSESFPPRRAAEG